MRRRAFVQTLGGVLLAGCSAPTRVREVDAGPEAEAPETPPLYPEGEQGLDVGNVLPPVDTTVYRDARGTFGSMNIGDFWDPDGSKGIHALVLSVSMAWCGPCGEFIEHLVKAAPSYLVRGARIVEVLMENNDITHSPATQKSVDDWIARHKIYFDCGLGPRSLLPPPPNDGFPLWYLIDPRTMRIFQRRNGLDGVTDTIVPGLDELLQKNGH